MLRETTKQYFLTDLPLTLPAYLWLTQVSKSVAYSSLSCFLCYCLSEHANAKFTVVPPPTVFGILGSDVSFLWKFSFGNRNDWSTFEQIYWRQTVNNDRIKNKYLAVKKDESVELNDRLPSSLKSRLNVTKTINQHGCSVQFVLQNVTWSDENRTYGCTAMVYGEEFKKGPIILDIQGESHFRLLFVYSLEQGNKCLVANNLVNNTQNNDNHCDKYYSIVFIWIGSLTLRVHPQTQKLEPSCTA